MLTESAEIYCAKQMLDTIGTPPPGLNTSALVLQSGDTRYPNSWLGREFALSPNGKWLAMSMGAYIYVLDVQTGLPLHWYHDPSMTQISKLAFSADDQWLYWAGRERLIRIAEVARVSLGKTISLEQGSTTALLSSPADPTLLYVGGSHHLSQLRSADTGSIIAELPFWDDDGMASHDVQHAAFSPAGDSLAVVSYRYLDVWNVRTPERVFRKSVDECGGSSVAFSASSDVLFVGSHAGMLTSYNSRTGSKELEHQLFQQEDAVHQVLRIPHTSELLCISSRGVAAIVSASSLKPRAQKQLVASPTYFQVHPQGRDVFGTLGNGEILRLSLASLETEIRYPSKDIYSCRFASDDAHITIARARGVVDYVQMDGQLLAQHGPQDRSVPSTHGSKTLRVRFDRRWLFEQITTQTGSVLKSRSTDITGSGLELLFENGDEWEIEPRRLCHRGTTTRYVSWPNFGEPHMLIASRDERRIAVRAGGTLTLVDTIRAEVIVTSKLAGGGSVALDSSAGGVVALGKKLGFFSNNDLQQLSPTPVVGDIRHLAITNDGTVAAAGCHDGTVVLVRRDDVKNTVRFMATLPQMNTLEFSNDGKLIAVGGTYPVLRVYSLETLFEQAKLSTPVKTPKLPAKTAAKKTA